MVSFVIGLNQTNQLPTMLQLLVLCLLSVSASANFGGLSEEKPANLEVTHLAKAVYPEVSSSVGETQVFQPISYKTQVVAGTNYFVKVKVSDTDYLHLRIFLPLGTTLHNLGEGEHMPELVAIETGHQQEDPIEYFQTSTVTKSA
eukprot:TRINITY_DN901_c0_g1_i1.p1 TRINITY_DN901_c0_g1~~TRINITY_DN901_c0_g1_i1.p1  ORF type:complete len:145 (-),score=19.79 TRINITY_DN901_c0_g1_i1:75-509(-)